MSEVKLFKSILLTLLAYGCISLFQVGTFLLPLPAFELVVLGISIYFGIAIWSHEKWFSFLFFAFGITQFLSRDYNYSFFLSDESMALLSQTIVIDLIYITSGILLGLLAFFHLRKIKAHALLLYTTPIFLVSSNLHPNEWLFLVPLFVLCLVFASRKSLFSDQHSFWLYLPLFTICKALSLLLL